MAVAPVLVRNLDDWPLTHRTLWNKGTGAKAGRLVNPKHADRLRPHSVRNAKRGYGAFLAVLFNADILIDTLKATDLRSGLID